MLQPTKPKNLLSLRPLELACWLLVVAIIIGGAWWHLGGDTQPRDAATMFTRIDVNAADKEELMSLPGMSSRRAQAILRERQKRGAFKNPIELTEVSGVTEAYFKRIEPLIEAK